jgi:O-antigen ligase
MKTATPSVAALGERGFSRVHGGDAQFAFGALVFFIFVVFACPGTVFPALAPFVPAKGIALAAVAALAGSCLLYRRALYGGGLVGAGLVAMLALAIASPVWSLWPEASTAEAIELAKYVTIALLIVNVVDSPTRLRAIFATIVVGAAIPAVGALRYYALGEHLVEGNRAAWLSTFGNPDELAYYLVCAIPLALALREMSRNRAVRVGLHGLVAIFATAIFLSVSRGGMLTLGAVALLWWARELRRGRIGFYVLAGLLCALALVPAHVWERAHTVVTWEDDPSAMGRIWTLQAGWKMFYAHPFLGLGAGTFMLAFPSYAPLAAAGGMAAHNSFVQVLAELGMGALAAFSCALAGAFAACRRAARSWPAFAAPAAGVQAALLGFVMSSLTGGIALSWPLYWLLGLSAAMAATARRRNG